MDARVQGAAFAESVSVVSGETAAMFPARARIVTPKGSRALRERCIV